MSGRSGRIDVHFHSVPPAYREAIASAGVFSMPVRTPEWSPELSLGLMDRHGIDAVVTSISVPGTHFGDDAKARALSRQCNDYAAECNTRWPRRFGAFAALPMPDLDGALREISYALDTLGLDGVGLFTSYDGDHLGHPRFDAVLEALDARGAVAFVHPMAHPSTREIRMGLPPYLVEYPFDTTRAAISLIFSGTMDRFPNIRFILSHAGGAVPFLSWRIAELTTTLLAEPAARARFPIPLIEAHSEAPSRDLVMSRLRRFWFDTACSVSIGALTALGEIAEPERILFGSDWPYVPENVVADTVSALDQSLADEARRAAVNRSNALALFPRLA